MAVSYLSKVYESNPYVLPVDLGLLARVNGYKQEQFYQNADKIGSMLSGLHNTDIANAAQSEKLKLQANNLSNQLNEAGGIDYSDRSLSNQIENYGSEIYNDPDITRGITSTKKIRAFQKNVEKMQTDPKLSKYYNVSNVTRIMEQQIKPYVNGDISASYDGPTAPRPYEGNPFEKMLKNMKNLPPDVTVKMSDSGTPSLYKISTNTELSAMDIDAAFDGLIDANTKAQLMDDAWYNFDYATGYKFDKTMGQQIYNNDQIAKSRGYQTHVDAIDIELKSITDKTLIEKKLKDKSDYIAAKQFAEGEITKGNNEFSKMWDQDPATAKYSLYMGKMRGDIIKTVGYSKEKTDFKINQEWVSNKKMEQTAFEKGYQLNTDGTWSKMPWADDGTKTTKGADGKTRNANGEIVEPLTTQLTNLDSSNRTDAQNKELKIDETAVNTQIAGYQAENNNMWKVLFQNLAQENNLEGTLGYSLNVNTTVDGIGQTFSSDLIGNLAGKNGLLEVDDINRVATAGSKVMAANPNAKNFNVNHQGGKFNITSDQIKILNTLKQGVDNYAQGNIAEIPNELKGMAKEWVDFAGKHRLNEVNINNRRQYLNNVMNTAITNAGVNLNSSEKARLISFESGEKAKIIGEKEHFNVKGDFTHTTEILDPAYESLVKQRKINVDKIAKYKKEAFEKAGQTYNYYSAILNNNKDVDDMLVRFITLEGKEGEKINVKPLAVRQNDSGKGWIIQYAYGKEGKEPTPTSIEISNAQASQIGIKSFAHPELEEAFRYGAPKIDNLLTYTRLAQPDGTEKIQPLKYEIVKRGAGDYAPAIIYQGKPYTIKTPQPMGSANEAYETMQTIASGRFASLEELVKRIDLFNSQPL